VQGSAQPFVVNQVVYVLYTCNDGRVIARQFNAPELPAGWPALVHLEPAPETIACPGTHKACAVLPPGTYDRQWADTVAAGR